VLEAHGLKSFDYRLLHAVLCQLSGCPLAEELRAFLVVDETLVDLADDLFDYEKRAAAPPHLPARTHPLTLPHPNPPHPTPPAPRPTTPHPTPPTGTCSRIRSTCYAATCTR